MKYFILIIFVLKINLVFSQDTLSKLEKKKLIGLNIIGLFKQMPEIHFDYKLQEKIFISCYTGVSFNRDVPGHRNSISNKAYGIYLDGGFHFNLSLFSLPFFIKISGTFSYIDQKTLVEIKTFYGKVEFPYDKSVLLRAITITEGLMFLPGRSEDDFKIKLYLAFHFFSRNQFMLLTSDYPVPGMGKIYDKDMPDASVSGGIVIYYCFN